MSVKMDKSYTYLKKAKKLIKSFTDGKELTDKQLHLLYDCAAERGQILENVIAMHWFEVALSKNIRNLDQFPCTPQLRLVSIAK